MILRAASGQADRSPVFSAPMRSSAHISLTLLAFVAMLWAQVFGLHRGFVCDCGGVAEVTSMDHCHGPESAPCREHDDHDESDTHEHAALIERLVAGNVIAMFAVPAPLVSVVEVPAWLTVEPVVFEETVSSTPDPPLRRSWPQVLTGSVVLRI
jgi:hypothetical protein